MTKAPSGLSRWLALAATLCLTAGPAWGAPLAGASTKAPTKAASSKEVKRLIVDTGYPVSPACIHFRLARADGRWGYFFVKRKPGCPPAESVGAVAAHKLDGKWSFLPSVWELPCPQARYQLRLEGASKRVSKQLTTNSPLCE